MSILMPAAPPRLRPGTLIHGPDSGVDDLIADFTDDLKRRGFRVGGVVQRNIGAGEHCAARMELIDIARGEVINISQQLGSGSRSCRVDPTGVAEASVVLRRAVTEKVDLLVVNKFAALEKDGRGLADELALGIAEGIPVLTSVSGRFLNEWQYFSGGLSVLLPPQREALWQWWGAHRLYDDLRQGVDDDTVRRIVFGRNWVMVEAAGGGTGLARIDVSDNADNAESATSPDHAGRGLRALAGLTASWDPTEIALGIAATNAHYNRPDRTGSADNGLDLFAAETGRVVVVGGFPGVGRHLPNAQVLDFHPRPGEYPAAAADWLLPGCDAAAITASSLVNRTLPRLLERAHGSRIALVGPGTPLTPRLFAYGIEILAGFVVTDPDGIARAIATGGSTRDFKSFGRSVTLRIAQPCPGE